MKNAADFPIVLGNPRLFLRSCCDCRSYGRSWSRSGFGGCDAFDRFASEFTRPVPVLDLLEILVQGVSDEGVQTGRRYGCAVQGLRDGGFDVAIRSSTVRVLRGCLLQKLDVPLEVLDEAGRPGVFDEHVHEWCGEFGKGAGCREEFGVA